MMCLAPAYEQDFLSKSLESSSFPDIKPCQMWACELILAYGWKKTIERFWRKVFLPKERKKSLLWQILLSFRGVWDWGILWKLQILKGQENQSPKHHLAPKKHRKQKPCDLLPLDFLLNYFKLLFGLFQLWKKKQKNYIYPSK